MWPLEWRFQKPLTAVGLIRWLVSLFELPKVFVFKGFAIPEKVIHPNEWKM